MTDYTDLAAAVGRCSEREARLYGSLLVSKARVIITTDGNVRWGHLLGELGHVLLDEADRQRDELAALDPEQPEYGEFLG